MNEGTAPASYLQKALPDASIPPGPSPAGLTDIETPSPWDREAEACHDVERGAEDVCDGRDAGAGQDQVGVRKPNVGEVYAQVCRCSAPFVPFTVTLNSSPIAVARPLPIQ